ncbi:hypothetical protein BIU82_14145 [Arthrobacter sp. SW1]|nr:hypothetical protein BIU82_14145 [Arthrobacter sp. SW1]
MLLSLLPDSDTTRSILEGALLSGTANARCDAADYFFRKEGSETVLLALAGDSQDEVAAHAIFNLARAVARNSDVHAVYIEALKTFSTFDGERTALQIIDGLETGTAREDLTELLSRLSKHPSVAIRRRVDILVQQLDA